MAVVPLRPGVLRVCAHEPDGAPGTGMIGLRVLLVADLLTRTAELFGLQAFTAVVGAGGAGSAAIREIDEELGFHRPDVYASCEQARLGLGGPVDVHVAGLDVASDLYGTASPCASGPSIASARMLTRPQRLSGWR